MPNINSQRTLADRLRTMSSGARLDRDAYLADLLLEAAEALSAGPAGLVPPGFLDAMLTGYHSVQVVFDSAQGAKDHLAALKNAAPQVAMQPQSSGKPHLPARASSEAGIDSFRDSRTAKVANAAGQVSGGSVGLSGSGDSGPVPAAPEAGKDEGRIVGKVIGHNEIGPRVEWYGAYPAAGALLYQRYATSDSTKEEK